VRSRTALQLALALLVAAPPAPAEPFKIRAFGDSITYSDFDPLGIGDPGRLESRLVADLWKVDVVNDGVNGERTVQALSRIDAELAQGGDLFLLMEGTNDIFWSVSEATILFNLDVLATKAEDAGMPAVHASVIPQYPCETKHPTSVRTGGLADALEIFHGPGAPDGDFAVIGGFSGPFTVALDASPFPYVVAELLAGTATDTGDYVAAVP